MKITTWNINGIRASNREEPLKKILDSLNADVICLQETKVTRELLEASVAIVDGYNAFFSFSRVKGGYSGVATFCKLMSSPCAAEEGLSGVLTDRTEASVIGNYGFLPDLDERELSNLDAEGRAVLTEHVNALGWRIVIVNVYCPRAERENETRQKYKLDFYSLLQARCEALMKAGRHVIIVGDFNVSHCKIDHCDPDADPECFQSNKSRKWISNFLYSSKDLKNPGSYGTVFDNGDLGGNQDFSNKDIKKYEGKGHKSVSSGAHTEFHLNENNMASAFHDTEEANTKFVDTFRYFHPTEKNAFTCWSTVTGARKTNYGTRIDYILACKDLAENDFLECSIRPEIMGSDHCPVEAILKTAFLPSNSLPSLCASLLPEFIGKQQSIKSYFSRSSRTENGSKWHNLTVKTGDKKRKASGQLRKTDQKLKIKKMQNEYEDCKSKNLLSFFTKSKNENKNLIEKDSRSCEAEIKQMPMGKYIFNYKNSEIDTSTESVETMAEKEPLTNYNVVKNCGSSNSSLIVKKAETSSNATGLVPSKIATNPKATSNWKSLFRGPEPPPLCAGHKEPCVLRTVKKEGPNCGKQFYCCARPQGYATNKEARCNYFVWRKKSR